MVSSLNHVCVWSEEVNAWVPITAQKAACSYPTTVRGREKRFICNLCGHYALLTGPGKNARHFRHVSPEDELDCPEYRYGASYSPTYSFREDHPLPIRLVLTDPVPHLEVGMLYVPRDMLQAQTQKTVTIITSQGSEFEYSFERLSPDTTTFLNVGNEPSKQYRVIAPSALYSVWPKQFEGIPTSGCLFIGGTGRKLPIDSDVTVDTTYYVLTSKLLWNIYRDIELKKRGALGGWNIYEVKALNCSLEAARFFLDFGYRLTENPLSIVPLWPMHRESSQVVRHSSNQMILAVSGRRIEECKLQPKDAIKTIIVSDTSRAVILDCSRRDQYFSIGRSNVLQYLYFWRENINVSPALLSIEVVDQTGRIIPQGDHDTLPTDGTLYITPPYDGKVIWKNGGVIVDQKELIAETRSLIEGITYGIEVIIYQGLDIVWSGVFKRSKAGIGNDDDSLYEKLLRYRGDPIPVYHELGALAEKLLDYPKVRMWVFSAVRKGIADRKAVQYLKHYVLKNSAHKG